MRRWGLAIHGWCSINNEVPGRAAGVGHGEGVTPSEEDRAYMSAWSAAAPGRGAGRGVAGIVGDPRGGVSTMSTGQGQQGPGSVGWQAAAQAHTGAQRRGKNGFALHRRRCRVHERPARQRRGAGACVAYVVLRAPCGSPHQACYGYKAAADQTRSHVYHCQFALLTTLVGLGFGLKYAPSAN